MKGRIMSDITNAVRKKFFDEDDVEVIKKVPDQIPNKPLNIAPPSPVKQIDDRSTFVKILETAWMRFSEWFKRSSTIIITMLLVGFACGMFVSKIIYDIRMNEISILAKTGSAGYVHNGLIYDVKLRP